MKLVVRSNRAISNRKERSEVESLEQCYSIQHLFRVIFVVVCGHNYTGEVSSVIGKMPVFIALTGEQEGLSEPITFDSIRDKVDAIINREPYMVVQTILDTAAKFLVDLERREITAVDRERSRFFEELGSSSQWVDTNIYTEWTGRGKDEDRYYAESQEEFQRMMWAPVTRK